MSSCVNSSTTRKCNSEFKMKTCCPVSCCTISAQSKHVESDQNSSLNNVHSTSEVASYGFCWLGQQPQIKASQNKVEQPICKTNLTLYPIQSCCCYSLAQCCFHHLSSTFHPKESFRFCRSFLYKPPSFFADFPPRFQS